MSDARARATNSSTGSTSNGCLPPLLRSVFINAKAFVSSTLRSVTVGAGVSGLAAAGCGAGPSDVVLVWADVALGTGVWVGGRRVAVGGKRVAVADAVAVGTGVSVSVGVGGTDVAVGVADGSGVGVSVSM